MLQSDVRLAVHQVCLHRYGFAIVRIQVPPFGSFKCALVFLFIVQEAKVPS